MNLRQYTDRYLALRASEVSPSTLRLDRQTVALLLRLGRTRQLAEIDPLEVAEWQTTLTRGRSANTARAHAKRARLIFARAVELGLIEDNPCAAVRIRGTRPEIVVPELTDADVAHLCQSAGGAWGKLFGLCAWAGLRSGEALALRHDDVGMNRITVREGKTGARQCRLEPQLADLIGQGEGLVAPVARGNLWREARKYIKRAGFEPWPKPLHGLRKWRATTWGLIHPEWVVDSWMGHGMAVAREHYRAVPDSMFGERNEK